MQTGPKYKICRRLGSGIFEKCQTPKFAIKESRAGGKGHAFKRVAPKSDYARQLLEKQRVRFSYGISEKQFSNYVKSAMNTRAGNPADLLFKSLETRLDNTVYRLGFATTRRAARQMVSHGHILVNGIRLNVPSHHVRENDLVTIRQGSQSSLLFSGLNDDSKTKEVPLWLSYDRKVKAGKVTGMPQMSRENPTVSFAPVLEFYSR